MVCLINQVDFRNLVKGSEITDKNGKEWVVQIAKCEGPKHFPTHFFLSPDGEWYRVSHNGLMFISGEKNEQKNGVILDFLVEN